MNIQFNYLYRDGGNYKQYHSEVFTNHNNLTLAEISNKIQDQLIDGEHFYHQKWQLKDLHYFHWDNEIDVFWHEFECIEYTKRPPTKNDIADFMQLIEATDNSLI